MLTRLPADDVDGLGFRKAETLSAAVELAHELAGPPRTTFVVPFGNTTVVRAPGAGAARVAA
jgi:hypothetical protein